MLLPPDARCRPLTVPWALARALGRSRQTAKWMSDPAVRKALHVDNAPAAAWPGPDAGWSYTSSYAACNAEAKPHTKSMIDFYRELAPALPGRIVVYNGDSADLESDPEGASGSFSAGRPAGRPTSRPASRPALLGSSPVVGKCGYGRGLR